MNTNFLPTNLPTTISIKLLVVWIQVTQETVWVHPANEYTFVGFQVTVCKLHFKNIFIFKKRLNL
jgi:hypothetical protein